MKNLVLLPKYSLIRSVWEDELLPLYDSEMVYAAKKEFVREEVPLYASEMPPKWCMPPKRSVFGKRCLGRGVWQEDLLPCLLSFFLGFLSSSVVRGG